MFDQSTIRPIEQLYCLSLHLTFFCKQCICIYNIKSRLSRDFIFCLLVICLALRLNGPQPPRTNVFTFEPRPKTGLFNFSPSWTKVSFIKKMDFRNFRKLSKMICHFVILIYKHTPQIQTPLPLILLNPSGAPIPFVR